MGRRMLDADFEVTVCEIRGVQGGHREASFVGASDRVCSVDRRAVRKLAVRTSPTLIGTATRPAGAQRDPDPDDRRVEGDVEEGA
jgi:hypothetical protein